LNIGGKIRRSVDHVKRDGHDRRKGTTMNIWEECDLVERVEGKMGGQLVIKGTRVQPEIIVENFEGGSDIEVVSWPWSCYRLRTGTSSSS
jgi:hypothetical protein